MWHKDMGLGDSTLTSKNIVTIDKSVCENI